ncbi:MAG TPA: ABC transporter permease [Anaerolineales bacterium]|nr:ABC transporter permease [Anaerolineales bacterium]
MRILDLALKDLSQMLRDKRSLLFIVAMPIVFTLFMGFAYKGSASGEDADTRITLAVVNSQPEAALNRALLARLDSSDAIRTIPLDEVAAMAALHKGDVAGVLIIPTGFSDQAVSPNSGDTKQLKLIAEPNSPQGQSLYQLLRSPISQLMSAVEIASISADLQGDPAEFSLAFELAWSKWDDNDRLNLVRTEQAVVQQSSDWTGGNPYNQASPGIIVQFAIFGLITSAQILVQERKIRTLQRLITTALSTWEIVAGHLLAMFALTFFQTAILIVFGQFALHVDYLREPLGTLLLAVALSLWVASVGLLIGVVAKEEQQVILFSMVAMFLFSALGGTWFPLETAGGAFAAIGGVLPSAWAMTGFQNMLIRRLELSSTLQPAAFLLGYAALFFTLALWRFRKIEM